MKGKALALLLRHDPARFGVSLDAAGWGSVDAVALGLGLDRAGLLALVAADEKGRFVVSEDGQRIRAAQGHSFAVDLGLVPVAPPEVLWHGTHPRALPAIRREGLRSMSRTHVHLSADEATARVVGSRRGRAVLLRVRAGEMHASGHAFYLSENGVWLTEAVPVAFIAFP
jgi:putative RNA 2'-phosphotransferase